MGRKARQKPKRLAEKLAQIRLMLGLSQNEMIRRLGAEDTLTQNRISDYELGVHEPSLITLLQYARAANVSVETLIDDELDLPEKLPTRRSTKG
jgi:transcriptional regulator with XRE-family HTH domain